jgi:hypothetical protein
MAAICKVVRLSRARIVYGKEEADDEDAYCIFFGNGGIQVGIAPGTLYLRWKEIMLIVYSFPTAVS